VKKKKNKKTKKLNKTKRQTNQQKQQQKTSGLNVLVMTGSQRADSPLRGHYFGCHAKERCVTKKSTVISFCQR